MLNNFKIGLGIAFGDFAHLFYTAYFGSMSIFSGHTEEKLCRSIELDTRDLRKDPLCFLLRIQMHKWMYQSV